MQIAPGNRGSPEAGGLANRMRPKLLATKVSGCYPIPVILRASCRLHHAFLHNVTHRAHQGRPWLLFPVSFFVSLCGDTFCAGEMR